MLSVPITYVSHGERYSDGTKYRNLRLCRFSRAFLWALIPLDTKRKNRFLCEVLINTRTLAPHSYHHEPRYICSRYGALTWEKVPRYCLDTILNGLRAISGLVVKGKTSSYLSEGRSSEGSSVIFPITAAWIICMAPGWTLFQLWLWSDSRRSTCGPRWQWFNLQHMQTVTLNSVAATTLLNDSLSHPTLPPHGPHHSINITTRFVCGPVIPTQLNPPGRQPPICVDPANCNCEQ